MYLLAIWIFFYKLPIYLLCFIFGVVVFVGVLNILDVFYFIFFSTFPFLLFHLSLVLRYG